MRFVAAQRGSTMCCIKPLLVRAVTVVYYVVFGLFFGGLLLGVSDSPDIGRYSYQYLAFLAALSVGFAVPRVLRKLAARHGRNVVILLIGSALLTTTLLYGAAALRYYYTRQYLFDPFLQVPPPPVQVAAREPGDATLRILMLGGSTTFTPGRPPATTYGFHVERFLGEALSGGFTLLNAGKPWYTTKHSTIDYATRLFESDPDVALILHGINDLYRSCTPPGLSSAEYKSDWSHFYGPAGRGAFPPTFEEYLAVGPLHWLTRKWLEGPRARWTTNEVDYDLSYYRSLPDFEKQVRQLLRLLRQDGVVPVLITQPSLYKPDMTSAEQRALRFGRSFCRDRRDWMFGRYPSRRSLLVAMNAYNDVTRKVAAESGVTLFDAADQVPRTLDYFIDDVHYSQKGAERLAEFISAQLIELPAVKARLRAR
jgi:lysophospholipase L1-like esterase